MARTKTQWKKLAKGLDVEVVDWLTVLPVYDEDGEAVTIKPLPIVEYPVERKGEVNEALRPFGLKLVWSTVHYVSGYHYPDGYTREAIGYLRKEKAA